MTGKPGHVEYGRIQEYIDGALDANACRSVAAHLENCPECRATWKGLTRFEESLRRLPLEKASRSLASSVMGRLDIAPRRDRTFTLLRYTGTAFAFLMVSAILVGVFVLTGVIDLGGGEGDAVSSGWLGAAGDTLSGTAQGAGIMTTKFFSFFSSQGGAAVLLFGVAVVGILGAADFFFRRGSVHHYVRPQDPT